MLQDFNDAAKLITQGRIETILGLTAEQLYSTPESTHLVDSLRRCDSDGQTIQKEFLYRLTTTGAKKWIRGTWIKLDADSIALHTEDITERKQAELALEKTKSKLESTLAALPDLFFEVDRSGKLLSYSTNDDSKLFRDPMEWLGRNVEEVLPADAVKTIMDAVAEADETGTHHGAQYGLELPDGQRWFELSIAKNRQAPEGSSRFVVLARDVSQRVQTESSLVQSEARYREMIETAYEGVWQIDTEGLTTFVNERLLEMLGYREEEMLGRPFFDFMSETEQALAGEYFQHRADGLAEQHEFTFRRKDGTDIYTLISASPITTDGCFNGALAMITDISERIEAENALRISEQKLASVLDNVQDVIWSMSWPDLELIYLSPSVENIYGYSVDQFFSQPDLWFTATHPDDRDRVDEIMENLKKKGRSERKHRVIRPDGKIVWLLNKSHLIYNENGEPIRIDGVATDISELQVLKGLLPICYSCKKIRDDDGYWHEVDAYITKNADVWFSHGLCQECFHELFPDIDEDLIEGKTEDSIDPQKRVRSS